MAGRAKKRDDQQDYWDQIDRFKEEVRERYPLDRAIEDLAGVRFVQRAGATSRMACCPFHEEKTPSFSVNPEAGFYHCFGNGCGARGDLFRFIMDHENVPFMQALQIAGRNAGVAFPTRDGKPVQAAPRKTGSRKGPGPQQDRRPHPGDMREHGLIPVPDTARTPSPGIWSSAWHPGNLKTPPGTRRYKPRMVHEYRNSAGQLLMSVLRVELPNKTRENGKPAKFFMPFRLSQVPDAADNDVVVNAQDRLGWLIGSVPQGHLRPVYGMEMIPRWHAAGGRKILVVEGEKTADAARRLLSAIPEGADWIVVSPLGGSNAALHADWSGLAEACCGLDGQIEVLVWPDADAPTIMRRTGERIDRQKAFASDIVNGLAHAIHRAGTDLDKVRFSRIQPIEGVSSGWDLADAEEEGWSGGDVVDRLCSDTMSVPTDMDFVCSERSARQEAEAPCPFDDDELLMNVEAYDALTGGFGDHEEKTTMTDHAEQPRDDKTDQTLTAETSGSDDLTENVKELLEHEVLDPATGDKTLERDPEVIRMFSNRYFRCLGYMDGVSYFMALKSGQVFDLTPAKMKPNYLLHLARADFWRTNFPGPADRNGVIRTDWEAATDALIHATTEAGQYDPSSHVGQGAWKDYDRIVFNSGRGLWVEGRGAVPIHEFSGEKNYVVDRFCGMPDFDNPFPADAPEIRQLLDIISAIHWAPEGRSVSIMNMFGWLAIGPICGVLPWRPHLYLSGERGVGKSWIINNIINPIFKDYAENVKADSTESGLRNLLNGRARPLVFDEAEGETLEDRQRMAKIIRLARHSATPGNSVVAQGIAGGGGQRQYAIASTFLMCSITPQLTASADFTRFGRAHLLGGLSHYDFVEQIKGPAERLFKAGFSARFMARMIIRARDMEAVSRKMQQGLSTYNIEQRLIDVYGTYLAGAWLLLRDDVPENGAEAIEWANDTFGMVEDLMSQIREVSEDKDHVRLFRTMLSADLKVESMAMGNRTYTVGELIETVLGTYQHDDAIPTPEALRVLTKIGIRLGRGTKFASDPTEADSLLIHRNSTHIEKLLKDTPYAKSYVDVMTQAKGVRKDDKMVRFDGTSSRIVVVPLANLSLGKDVIDGRTEPDRGE